MADITDTIPGLSDKFRELSKDQKFAILNDMTATDNRGGTVSMDGGDSAPVYGGPLSMGAGGGGSDDPTGRGPLAAALPPSQVSAAGPVGALTQTAPEYHIPTMQEAMAQFAPQDDSRSMYLALAAGLGKATKTGSLGESIGNAADALSTVRQEQDKLKMQYLPMIMTQMAQQQMQSYQMKQNAEGNAQLQAYNRPQGPAQMPAPGQPGVQQGPAGGAGPQAPQAWNPAEHGGLLKPIPQALQAAIYQLPFAEQGAARAKLIQEYSTPKWENINGNMVNTMSAGFKGGIQPGVYASASGDVIQTDMGPDGKLTISSPKGAVEAKLAQQGGAPVVVKMGTQEVQMSPAEFNAFATTGAVPARLAGTVGARPAAAPGAPAASGEQPALGVTASSAELARQAAEKEAMVSSAKGQVDNGTKYEARLLDTHAMNETMMQRNAQIQPLLDQVKTGKIGQSTFAQLGTYLENAGVSAPTVQGWLNKMAGGDPSVVKTIENQLAAAGITTMLTTLDKEGSPNRAMFAAVHEAQESLKSGNLTLKRVMDLQTQAYKNTLDEVHAMDSSKEAGTYNPARWGTSYAKVRAAKYLPADQQPGAAPVRRFNADGSVSN